MPQEINKIPYEGAEDLRFYLYDNYYSTENIDVFTSGTGEIKPEVFEFLMSSGVTQGSVAMANYNNLRFNPLYAEAVWKMSMNDMDNSLVFFGFKETLLEPTIDMIESHAGFFINDGKLYASTADGATQQIIEIVGIDATLNYNYKIEYNKFSLMPLPVYEESLGLPTIFSVERVWKLLTTLSNIIPENKVHYIVQYIKSATGGTKSITFNRFIYKEVYAD